VASETGLGPTLGTLFENEALIAGFDRLGSARAYWRQSDHISFVDNLGVPVLFVFAGEHPDIHQPTDTVDRVDVDKVARVAQVIEGTVRALDATTAP
jgi:hypothetical protein